MEIARRAAELVEEDNIVGLGTGRAATAFLHALAKRINQGLHVRGIPTSKKTADTAEQLGIPLCKPGEVSAIDITVDGADEVDPELNLIKGYGGALIREKIIAAGSRRLIILVTPEKLVPALGTRGTLPVEVVPYGMEICQRMIQDLGLPSVVRAEQDHFFSTDNGNFVLDCEVGEIGDPFRLEQQLVSIPGVVGTGMFLGMADAVFVQDGDQAIEKWRS